MRDATWPARRGTALTTVPRRAAGYAERHLGNWRRQRYVAAAHCFLSSGVPHLSEYVGIAATATIIKGAVSQPRIISTSAPRAARRKTGNNSPAAERRPSFRRFRESWMRHSSGDAAARRASVEEREELRVRDCACSKRIGRPIDGTDLRACWLRWCWWPSHPRPAPHIPSRISLGGGRGGAC